MARKKGSPTKGRKKRRPIYTDAQILAALKEWRAKVYLAAKHLGCDPTTIYDRAKTSEQIAAAIKNSRGELVDVAETHLEKAAIAGEQWAIERILRTLGKDRGHGDKSELELTGIELEIVEKLIDAPDANPS